jgi:hypothetical protein
MLKLCNRHSCTIFIQCRFCIESNTSAEQGHGTRLDASTCQPDSMVYLDSGQHLHESGRTAPAAGSGNWIPLCKPADGSGRSFPADDTLVSVCHCRFTARRGTWVSAVRPAQPVGCKCPRLLLHGTCTGRCQDCTATQARVRIMHCPRPPARDCEGMVEAADAATARYQNA